MRELRILLYGDIDLNIMDGSAVWLSSMAAMLSKNKNTKIDLLKKSKEQNTHLTQALKDKNNIRMIQPYTQFSQLKFSNQNRMNVKEAVEVMTILNKKNQYHLIIVRGFDLVRELMKVEELTKLTVPYLTDFKHDSRSSEQERRDLKSVYNHFSKMFLQTKETKEKFKQLIHVDGEKIELLYPMIPDINEIPSYNNNSNRLIYSGKFHEDWYTEEILSVAKRLKEKKSDITIQIVGDKFQERLREKKNQQRIIESFKKASNIDWVGAVSREKCQQLIKNSDVGISWRSERLDNDDSVELSSKLLEYGRLGKPALVRKTSMHENLLGSDYPLFVDDEKSFIEKLNAVLSDADLYKEAAEKMYKASKMFTYSESYSRLKNFLWSYNREPIKIVFAGHDLKFATMIIEYFQSLQNYEVKIDQWQSHEKHDEKHSRDCLEWADIIFCEWGLGNSVWYSNNKKEGQKLIVRMHFQEKDLKFPKFIDIDNVDKFIVITPYMFEEFHKNFRIPREKILYIDNLIDAEKLDKPKEKDSLFHLGICGILPARKRIDIAVDIFEKLWEKDHRYKLFIKGKKPEEVSWLMARESERKYYEAIFSKINNAPWKKNVIFDSHGNDVDKWLKKIGYLLSTSDYEGSHVAISEGMASGSYPIIRNWKGADSVYPVEYIEENVNALINKVMTTQMTHIQINELKKYALEKFDKKFINRKINKLITESFIE